MYTISEVKGNVTTQNFIEQINANNEKTNKNFEEIETKLMKDYIVEQGTTDIWTWEKWASGKATVWGRVNCTYSNSWVAFNKFTLPISFFGVFCTTATIATLSGNVNEAISQNVKTEAISSNEILVGVHDSGGRITTTASIPVNINIVGKWKDIYNKPVHKPI